MRRCTLAQPAATRGEGLFTARAVMLALRPAPAGTGVVFRRVDLPGTPEIPATIDRLSAEPIHPAFADIPPRCSCLVQDPSEVLGDGPPARVGTVEHLLGALAGLGITDAIIELDAEEVPIFDGSAGPLAMIIEPAELDQTIEPIVVTRRVVVEDESGRIVASPRAEPGCVYRYELDYGPHPAIPPQCASWTTLHDAGSAGAFVRSVAPARTFSLEAEARALKAAGLFPRLTPREMLVLGPMGPIDNALRFEDEPARHKLLDLIGDLALVGRPIQASIVAQRSGHALNHALAARLAAPD